MGVQGYVCKARSEGELEDALFAVLNGEADSSDYDEDYDEDDDESPVAGPAFCPHCGKPLR
jgi:hypothetical protein